MTAKRTMTRKLIALSFAAPLTLALAACGGDSEESLSGEPIEAIAAPDGTSWLDVVNVSENGGFVMGNPDAPLKLVEYASHTCGACAYFSTTGKAGVKKYVETGVVSFEQRETFLGTMDVVLASLAQCGPKEQMQPLSDEIWANLPQIQQGLQANGDALNAAAELPLDQRFVRIGEVSGLIDFFAARGVSADQARSCLADSAKMEAMVEQVTADNQASDVTGTPTFFLNGNKLNTRGWEELELALQDAGARIEETPAAEPAAAE